MRRQEQQAGHQRKLAERQRVGAPAEVQVHDPALRGSEAAGHQPPRHIQLARPCADRPDERHVGDHGGQPHDRREEPDLGLEPELSSEQSHRSYSSKSVVLRKLTLRKLTRDGSTSPLAVNPQSQRKLARLQVALRLEPLASRKLARRKLARAQSISPVAGSIMVFGARFVDQDEPESSAEYTSITPPAPGTSSSVARSAPFTRAGDQYGRSSRISAAAPETTAVAIEVPPALK